MKTLKTLLTVLIILSITQVAAQDLKLNTNTSSITWTGKAAFNAYSLTGSLKAKKGTVKIENNQITELTIAIDMKSLDHDNNDLKTHLRGKDFFEVKKYTTATFKISKPAIIENNKAILVGDMTIKNSTKEEIVEVTINDTLLSFNHTMDRTIYGIKFNSPSFFKKMKENAIADAFILKGILAFN